MQATDGPRDSPGDAKHRPETRFALLIMRGLWRSAG